jgi:hypothetical protein
MTETSNTYTNNNWECCCTRGFTTYCHPTPTSITYTIEKAIDLNKKRTSFWMQTQAQNSDKE